MLDAWFRDVCNYYRDMPSSAREAIRKFLNFDMASAKDIFLQDQLQWGVIEPNRKDKPVLIVQKSALKGSNSDYMDELETISNADVRNSIGNVAKSLISDVAHLDKFISGSSSTAAASQSRDASRPVSVYSGGKHSVYSPDYGVEGIANYGR